MADFEYRPMTPEIARLINDATDSANPNTYRARRARGEYLGWELGTFLIGKDKKPDVRGYVCWHEADGTLIGVREKGIPVLQLQVPVAPVKAVYVTMKDVFHYDSGDPKTVVQKFVFDIDDHRFDDWNAFKADLDDVLNVQRAAFLIDNIAEPSLLDAKVREIFKKKGKEAAIEKILESINDDTHHAHHYCHWSKAKSKLFKVRDEIDGMRISPAVQTILDHVDNAGVAFDSSGKVKDYLLAGDTQSLRPFDLNLLRIVHSDGVSVVKPGELGRLHADGMFAMHTLTLFGIGRRPDGQHYVMVQNSGVQLCTNGLPKEAAVGIDVASIMAAKPAETKVDIEAIMRDVKRQKTGG